jgi:uncharacterized LabA/DUF88 family protein
MGCFEMICREQSRSREWRSMNFYPSERVALFIDGANLYATARSLGFDIDYKRLLSMFRTQCLLLRANYYTVVSEEQAPSNVRPLIDWLDYNGYALVTKTAKTFADNSAFRKKGDMDIEIAVDALLLADTVDHVVLFSGDGHFTGLVVALQQKGKRVSVVSSLETSPPMVADTLRRQADQFIDLADVEKEITRPPFSQKQN